MLINSCITHLSFEWLNFQWWVLYCLILYFISVLSTQERFSNFQLPQTFYIPTNGHALVNYHVPGYNSVLHATHVHTHLINCMYICIGETCK